MSNGKHNTLSPTLIKVLEIAKLNKPVSPSEINDYVGNGNYASKHVLYLRGHGYEFSTVKDGRTVTSYTLIKVPSDHEQLISAAYNKKNKVKAPKAAKTVAAKTVKVPKQKVKAPTKAEIKSANLAKLKAVGAKYNAENNIPKASSFSVDGDWDSIDGLDLKNLL